MNLQQVAFWLNIYFKGEIRDIFTESRYYFRDWLGWLKRVVLVLEEILLGMNSRSFELLFILRWEIVPLFVSNEKLLLNFVFSIRTFVFYEKKVSYARILREESLIFALNENSRFNCQCLKRYTNYSNSISLPFARNKNIFLLWWRRRHILWTQ